MPHRQRPHPRQGSPPPSWWHHTPPPPPQWDPAPLGSPDPPPFPVGAPLAGAVPCKGPWRDKNTIARSAGDRAGALALGDPAIRERNAHACAAHHLSMPVVQPTDTTCSVLRPPPLMRSALPSQEALSCRTLRDPLATLAQRPVIPITPKCLTSSCSRSTNGRPTRHPICQSRIMGCPNTPLAYLGGNVVGLDRRSEKPTPPLGGHTAGARGRSTQPRCGNGRRDGRGAQSNAAVRS